MERLQELKNEVATQKLKLKSLQQQKQQQKHQQWCSPTLSNGGDEQDTMNALIFLKEKELALALMKVAELTSQLERLKRTEVKSESPPPRLTNRNAPVSSLRTSVPISAVENTSEKCQEFDIVSSSSHAKESNGSKTIVFFEGNADKMKPSRSFDASVVSPRGRSSSREKFFSTSLKSTSISADSSSSFPSSFSNNSFISKMLTSSSSSSSSSSSFNSPCVYSFPSLIQTNDSSPSSNTSRPSTSSSIMSRFAPKPYSSRSMSVDCGIFRRHFPQNTQIRSQDDTKTSSMLSSIPVSNSGHTSKTPNVCLLPKSASFHYGYNEKENALIKARRSECQTGKTSIMISQNSSSDLSSNAVGIFKPKITPKPFHLINDFRLSPSSMKHSNNITSHSNSTPSFYGEYLKKWQRSSMEEGEPIQANNLYRNPSLCNNLTITLSTQGTSQDFKLSDSIQPSNHDDHHESVDKGNDAAEVFKRGCVRELSKIFSRLPMDDFVDATSKKENIVCPHIPKDEKYVTSKSNEPSVSTAAPSEECLASQDEEIKTSSSSLAPGIDISANAVSSALSILLSGNSTSKMSRHAIASRPNRLFGYSSSFSRPKFLFVPSDQMADPNQHDKDVESVPGRPEPSDSNAPFCATKAPTIYSLFSPPPKARLSTTTSPDKFPKTNDQSNSVAESKTSTKKSKFLPRLSYITLSSNITQDSTEEEELPKVKSKKRVTIDPSFLYLSAAVEGELDIIKSVIPRVPDPDLSNDNGMTALHMAVCNNNVEIVKFLLDYGCSVNAPNCESWTPLHFAALGNKKDIVEVLVWSGACVHALSASDYETPVQKCQSKIPCYEDCIKVLTDFANQLGSANEGIVYSTADYDAECPNECSLKDGEILRILRKGDEVESEWWWASKTSGDMTVEGYVPRSILSFHPRRPQMWRSK